MNANIFLEVEGSMEKLVGSFFPPGVAHSIPVWPNFFLVRPISSLVWPILTHSTLGIFYPDQLGLSVAKKKKSGIYDGRIKARVAGYLPNASGRSTNNSGDVRVLIQDVNVMIGQDSHHRRIRIATGRPA